MVEEFDDGYTCNQLFCLSVFFVFLPSSCLLVFLSSCLVSGQVFERQLGLQLFGSGSDPQMGFRGCQPALPPPAETAVCVFGSKTCLKGRVLKIYHFEKKMFESCHRWVSESTMLLAPPSDTTLLALGSILLFFRMKIF